VPTTLSGFLRSPYWSTHSLAMIQVEVEASRSRNQALGSRSVNFTVYLSGASTLSTISRMYLLLLPLMLRKRS